MLDPDELESLLLRSLQLISKEICVYIYTYILTWVSVAENIIKYIKK